MNNKQKDHHVPALQSIRGIAAVVVVLHHATFTFVCSAGFHYWSEVLLNAHGAVVLFFVLSGYVLTRSLSDQPLSLRQSLAFYAARCFRIYPALWVACILMLSYYGAFHFQLATPGLSAWFEEYDLGRFKQRDVLLQFLGLRSVLIPPSWSITVEIYGSILLPLLALVARAGWSPWLLLGTSLVAILPVSAGHSWVYCPSFVAGVVAYRYREPLVKVLGSLFTFAVSVCVLWFFRRLSSAWNFDVDPGAPIPSVVESIAAIGVVLGAASLQFKILNSRTAVWLGDISYSVYLLHYVVLATLAHLLVGAAAGDVGALLLAATTLCVTLVLSTMTYRLIERPGIQIGKAFAIRSGIASRI